MEQDERIREAIERTEILRAPKQNLYTFGTTNIYYYLVTKPAYSDVIKETAETVLREGRVIAERPKIVTPYYLDNLEGFSPEARRYFQALMEEHGTDIRGLFYSYRNEPKGMNIITDNLDAIVDRLNAEIDRRSDPLTAIIKGEDTLWDVSIMKFIYEVTRNSAPDNLRQMGRRGLLNMDSSGVPADARAQIEDLFRQVARGEADSAKLKDELERWGLFEEYQDRFLALFRNKR
jgi:succinate dehydrogenase flavin-adding protein (antitoxin of CptAB toxin-antitoxin module)